METLKTSRFHLLEVMLVNNFRGSITSPSPHQVCCPFTTFGMPSCHHMPSHHYHHYFRQIWMTSHRSSDCHHISHVSAIASVMSLLSHLSCHCCHNRHEGKSCQFVSGVPSLSEYHTSRTIMDSFKPKKMTLFK